MTVAQQGKTAAQQGQTASRASKVQKVVTPLGIEAWLVEDYTVPLVAMDFAFTAGASNDPAGKPGVANMMAALLDEGAGEMNAEAFHRALDDTAVELSFHSGTDTLNGDLKTLTRHTDEAFELLRKAVNEPRFDDDAVERLRSQVIAGLRREAKDPDSMVTRAWREASYGDHPYSRPVSGTLESVPTITRDDIVAAHKRLFARDLLKIAVVGAIDAGRLAGLLDKTFGALPPQSDLPEIPEVEVATATRKIVALDVPQTTIRFSLPGIPRHDPDFMAAIVLNHILGGGVFSARLFKEVREKRGLAYSVWSALQTFRHSPLFSGGTSTKNERAAESISVIEEEIAKLTADGPTGQELASAKKYLIGSYALRFDTSTKIAGNLVHLQVDGYPVEFLDQRNDLIEAVTLEDTRRVARRLFEGKKLLVAAVGKPEGLV
jgi:zinc protease